MKNKLDECIKIVNEAENDNYKVAGIYYLLQEFSHDITNRQINDILKAVSKLNDDANKCNITCTIMHNFFLNKNGVDIVVGMFPKMGNEAVHTIMEYARENADAIEDAGKITSEGIKQLNKSFEGNIFANNDEFIEGRF